MWQQKTPVYLPRFPLSRAVISFTGNIIITKQAMDLIITAVARNHTTIIGYTLFEALLSGGYPQALERKSRARKQDW